MNHDGMKLHVHVCTHNEELMLPHFLKFYKKYTDYIFVHDQHSTDRTLEIAHSFDCIVDTFGNDFFDTAVKQNTLMEGYKKSIDCDYVIIVDCDEFMVHDNLIEKLKWCKQQKILVPKCIGYEMYHDNFDFVNGNIDSITHGVLGSREFGQKQCIVKSNETINYSIGCHHIYSPTQRPYPDQTPIKYCHMKYINTEYIKERHAYFHNRRSDENKKKGYGVHYSKQIQPVIDRLKTQSTKIR